MFEAGDGVGGTWYWNRYPGARCDVESLDYSYSFSPSSSRSGSGRERYPTQPEILRYVNHVADRFDLRRDIQFDTRVDGGDVRRGRAALDGRRPTGRRRSTPSSSSWPTGCLSHVEAARDPGLDAFAGRRYHTGRWPHEGVDFTGQRVGVIGTGSSGVQSIPLIAEQAAELTVFQRTPNYSHAGRERAARPDEVDAS